MESQNMPLCTPAQNLPFINHLVIFNNIIAIKVCRGETGMVFKNTDFLPYLKSSLDEPLVFRNNLAMFLGESECPCVGEKMQCAGLMRDNRSQHRQRTISNRTASNHCLCIIIEHIVTVPNLRYSVKK